MSRRNLLTALAAMLTTIGTARGQYHEPDADAVEALKDVVESFRARKAVTVTTKLSIGIEEEDLRSQPQDNALEITRAADRGVVRLNNGFTCYLGDGTVAAVHDATEHSYFSIEDDDSPYYTLLQMFMDLPYPMLAMAFGEPEIDDFFFMQFHPKAAWARPTAVADQVDEDGRAWRDITMSSDHSNMVVRVDPDTKLIHRITLTVSSGPFAQAGTELIYRHTYEYDLYENEPLQNDALVFDPQQRQRVDSVATLAPAPEPPSAMAAGGGGLVGRPAPDLVLATSDGGAVDLTDLQGQVVVLDFWATWCPPCRRALPMLHDVRKWALEAGLPVTVLTVNTFERDQRGEAGPDVRLANVQNFWRDQRYTLPVAMDYTDEVAAAYGVQGIPATFIIRSDGVVHAAHSGVGDDYVASLQSEIRDALAALEAPDPAEAP